MCRCAVSRWGRASGRSCVASAIVGQISDAKRRGVRVLHDSIQDIHLHLMVEGRDSADLASDAPLVFAHRVRGERGRPSLWKAVSRPPKEVRNALVDILFNDRKHARGGDAHGHCRCRSRPLELRARVHRTGPKRPPVSTHAGGEERPCVGHGTSDDRAARAPRLAPWWRSHSLQRSPPAERTNRLPTRERRSVRSDGRGLTGADSRARTHSDGGASPPSRARVRVDACLYET